jgi:dihydroorotate dehydrogenase electron transfer subunit
VQSERRIEVQNYQRHVGGENEPTRQRIGEHPQIPHGPAGLSILPSMVRDVAAAVLSNVHLSANYNVLSLAAPEIALETQPGQFVMVKPDGRSDPLLRRPFSVFEILRDGTRVIGLSLLSKRIGVSTTLLFDARPGDRILCLGPLGKPFVPVDPPAEAWMVAGGVGLAPFVSLAETLRRRGTIMRLYYGGRRATDLFYLDFFDRLGVRLVLATEDGSRGADGLITTPLQHDLHQTLRQCALYACGPEPMLAAVAKLAAAAGRSLQVSVERVMGCGLGGCYSCVIPVRNGGRTHFVRSCLAGPVFAGDAIDWDAARL